MDVDRTLEALDRSTLDAGARAAVLEAMAAQMTMPAPNDSGTAYNRRQYRAAASWMRRWNRRVLRPASEASV